jgi:hypothetical protein
MLKIYFIYKVAGKKSTKFKFEWRFMLNKGSEIVYLFILSYGHLDLLTSMYSYQDATKFHGSGHLQIILHLKKIMAEAF